MCEYVRVGWLCREGLVTAAPRNSEHTSTLILVCTISLHWKEEGFLGETILGLEYLADGHVSEGL